MVAIKPTTRRKRTLPTIIITTKNTFEPLVLTLTLVSVIVELRNVVIAGISVKIPTFSSPVCHVLEIVGSCADNVGREVLVRFVVAIFCSVGQVGRLLHGIVISGDVT